MFTFDFLRFPFSTDHLPVLVCGSQDRVVVSGNFDFDAAICVVDEALQPRDAGLILGVPCSDP